MGIIYKNGTYYGGGSGGGGAEVTVDNELSSISENPVQNKVIKAELDNKQDADDLMTVADMDDVVTPLPGIASRLPRYSTEEQIVGYWIDGKPIYQKTFQFAITNVVSGTASSLEQNLSFSIDKLIDEKIIALMPVHKYNIAGSLYVSNSGINQIKIYVSNQNKLILVVSDANYNNSTAYVTIQYIKSID